MKKKSLFSKEITLNISSDKPNEKNNEETVVCEASFETAIDACRLGKFNVLLIALSVPCGWSSMMDTTTMSYVIPAAHCDLDMDLQQRGTLNAITYLGMITSALVWGFLADTLGRKKIIVVGLFADGLAVIVAAMSQSYEMLVTAKFFTGLIVNGPFAILTALISEFHSAKHRAKTVMALGIVMSLAQLFMPGLAWAIIPKNMDFELLDGRLKLHSWNFFILLCAIPALASSIGFCFLPESPKFLMTTGKNEKALEVFKKIYSINTGLHPDTFPIKSLVDEIKMNAGGKHGNTVTANRTKTQALKEGWQQISPILFPPHGLKLLLAATIQFGFMMGMNTIRLWLPQIFTAMNDYQMLHPEESANLCTMLEIITPSNVTTTTECVVNTVSDFVYTSSMIVAGVSIIGYIAASSVINKTGKKPTMITLTVLSGIATIAIYFAINSAMTVALTTVNITLIGISLNVEMSILVDMFPTTLRAVAVSVTLMIGRCGAMIGNLLFPYLLSLGCMPPFVLVGCVLILCSLLAIFLPKTDMKALE